MEEGRPMKIEVFELKGISVDIPGHGPLNLDKKHVRDGSRKSMEENSNEEAESQMQASQIQQITPLYSEILDGPPPRVAGKVIIHCVRHAESEHNLWRPRRQSYRILNPALTDMGRKQALMLQETFSPMDKITHIVCSPMRRTLQTALLGFQPLLDRGLKIVAYPDLREWGNSPSSSGYPLDLLETQYAGKPLDLSLVPEGWEINREDQWDKSRASIVREELWMLGNQALQTAGGSWKNCALPPREILTQNVEILVVSHGSFLATLVDANKHGFENTRYKSYEFASEEMVKSGFSPHMLVETEESMKRIQVILQDDDEMLSDLNDPVLLASNLESKVAPSATVCYMKGLALPNNAVATESIKSLQFVTEE